MRIRFLILLLSLACLFSIPNLHASPPANQGGIDASGLVSCTIRICSSSAFSTTVNNDLILIAIYEGTSGTGLSSITDAAGLLFYSRAGPLTVSSVLVMEEWITTTKDLLSSDILTIAIGGPASQNWNFTFIAISGSYYSSPFDAIAPITGKGSSCSGWPTFTLLKTPEMLISFAGSTGTTLMTLDQGFTSIGLGPNLSAEYQIFNSFQSSLQPNFNQKPCTGSAKWGILLDVICVNTYVGCAGGGIISSNPSQLQSVSGPGGYPIPPQVADSNVLSFMAILSGIILLSSLEFKVSKKRKDRFTGI